MRRPLHFIVSSILSIISSIHFQVRPVLHNNDTVTVIIKHTFNQIVSLEERKELFLSNGYCSFRWTDRYLVWNPEKYDGIEKFTISPENVWVPDIILHNELDSGSGFASNVDNRQNRLTISHTGNIVWGLRSSFVTKCHFDVTFFPFDMQSCTFDYGSWSYEKGKLDISPKSRIVVHDPFSHNGWYILNQSTVLHTEDYSGSKYETVKFSISFKRKALSTTLNLLLPPLIVGMLVLVSFVLPAASGERLALTVTLLLSLIFYTVNITDLIPSDDAAVPIFFMFFVTILIEIVILIIVLIFALQLYHKEVYDPPMREWIRFLFLDRLSYLLGIRERQTGSKAMPVALEDSHVEDPQQHTNGVSYNKKCHPPNEGVNNVMRRVSTATRRPAYVHHDDDLHDKDEMILMEWRIVALTVDKCLLYFFTFVWVVTITAFTLFAMYGSTGASADEGDSE